jgi:hypothetical protein
VRAFSAYSWLPLLLIACSGGNDDSDSVSSQPSFGASAEELEPDLDRYCHVTIVADFDVTEPDLASYETEKLEQTLAAVNAAVGVGARFPIGYASLDFADTNPPRTQVTGVYSLELRVSSADSNDAMVRVREQLDALDSECSAEQLAGSAVYFFRRALTIYTDKERKQPLCTLPAGLELQQEVIGSAFVEMKFATSTSQCAAAQVDTTYYLPTLGLPADLYYLKR